MHVYSYTEKAVQEKVLAHSDKANIAVCYLGLLTTFIEMLVSWNER